MSEVPGRAAMLCPLPTRPRRAKSGPTPRLVCQWIASIGLDPSFFGTHPLRRTKATLIYRRTGNLQAVQLLLGHKKIESTVRYLGIEVDETLAIAQQVDIWPAGAEWNSYCPSHHIRAVPGGTLTSPGTERHHQPGLSLRVGHVASRQTSVRWGSATGHHDAPLPKRR
jgi:hypothetical protein